MMNKKHILILTLLIALTAYLASSSGAALALAGPGSVVTEQEAEVETESLVPSDEVTESLAPAEEGEGVGTVEEAELENNEAEGDPGTADETELETTEPVEAVPRIIDMAELFSDKERMSMESFTAEIFKKYGHEILVVTVDDTRGKNTRNYADDFFDTAFPNDADGGVLLLDMDNRQIYLSTDGKLIDVLRDVDVMSVVQAGQPEMRDGRYGDAAMTMLRRLDYFLSRGIVAGQFRQEEQAPPEPNSVTSTDLGIAGLGGLGTGAAYFAGKKRRYKGRKRPLRYNLGANRAVNIIPTSDQIIDTRIHAIPLPRDNNDGNFFGGSDSGNMSSTHTSSSGDTHGGGGVGF